MRRNGHWQEAPCKAALTEDGYAQVVRGEEKQGTLGFLYGTQILVVVHGTVIAGIDMEKILPGDMRMENGVLYVNLPPA